MTAHDDRTKAMLFEHPEYVPVSASAVPAVWMKYRDEYDRIVRRHPILFGEQPEQRDYDAVSRPSFRPGEWADPWGCVWANVHEGLEGMVKGYPLPRREMVRDFEPPAEDDDAPHGFMYMRLFYLRGFEELMIDFAEEPPELAMLIEKVLAYNVRQVRRRLAHATRPGTLIHFGDDLGIQHALPISPEKWRKYLKPCYAKLYGMVRDAGHYVYMHSDGHFFEVIPDLVECGVNVINPQFRANGLDNLVRVCKGKVCADLDLDRQMMPFATPGQIDEHVRTSIATLGAPEGGLWVKAEIGPDYPLANIEAVCSALEKYRGYFKG